MNHRMTIAQICGAVESPLFDRKSARIDAKTLAIHLIAFANADGGMIAVGVEMTVRLPASTAMRSISTSCFVRRLTSASPPCGWKRNGSPA